MQTEDPWKERFSIHLWLVWKWRNDRIFRNQEPGLEKKLFQAPVLHKEVKAAMSNNYIVHGGQGRMETVWVGWNPPPHGWIMLNTNGCKSIARNAAGVGGIFRDHNGEWISGFPKRLQDRRSRDVGTSSWPSASVGKRFPLSQSGDRFDGGFGMDKQA